ncbi:2Fe-2S iron-sulfur cluster-binding protein [uncultured Brachyspira sp.]|uniref:2Fe-2S iron-sulfur cluster-binding protein n=1 Tax=uncultured Brachyspira sp. TaxID=221953 RepID=UPI0025F1096D|nr:2Fe-2S iron-sulfur cluster-binding protein [uncultured Brachyspira sp.]
MIVRFNFDGREILSQSGFTILKALSYVGIEIAHLCYYKLDRARDFYEDNDLLRCKLCLVKVKKKDEEEYSFKYACNEIVENGMYVISNDEEIIEYRKSLLKAILYMHRPFCDKCSSYYNCKLKKYIDFYQLKIERCDDDSKLEEIKNIIDSLNLDENIKVDYDKCINCGVCNRYKAISGYNSMIVDLCPTKVFRLDRAVDNEEQIEYKKINSFCIGCNKLCECSYFYDDKRLIDIQSPELKKYGICDFGRKMLYYSNKTFEYPLINGIEDDFNRAKDLFHKFLEETDKKDILVISSALYPMEDLEAFNDFIYSLGITNFMYKKNIMTTDSNVVRGNYTNINKYSSKNYKYTLNEIDNSFNKFIILEDPLFEMDNMMDFIQQNRRNYIVFTSYSSILAYNSYLTFPIAGFGEFEGEYIDSHGKNKFVKSFLEKNKNRLEFKNLIKYLYL